MIRVECLVDLKTAVLNTVAIDALRLYAPAMGKAASSMRLWFILIRMYPLSPYNDKYLIKLCGALLSLSMELTHLG